VCDEIEHLIERYGVREIAFQDDNLTLDKERMHSICDEIIRRKIDIKWCTPNGVAIWTLDEDLIRKMKKAGCYKLTFGIETASFSTQQFIRKTHLDLERAKEIIAYCNKIGLWTHASFIIGFPHETQEEINETIKYALDSDLDFGAFFVATPFPGTELYEIYRREGLFNTATTSRENAWKGCQQVPICDTNYFSCSELHNIIKTSYKNFYRSRMIKFLNPLRLFRKMRRIEDVHFVWKLVCSYKSTINSLMGG